MIVVHGFSHLLHISKCSPIPIYRHMNLYYADYNVRMCFVTEVDAWVCLSNYIFRRLNNAMFSKPRYPKLMPGIQLQSTKAAAYLDPDSPPGIYASPP